MKFLWNGKRYNELTCYLLNKYIKRFLYIYALCELKNFIVNNIMTSYQPDSVVDIQHNLLDNFNKLRVTSSTTILDVRHTGGAKNSIYEVEKSTAHASATYSSVTGPSTVLTLTSAVNTNYVTRQTREYITFQQGKPIITFITANMNPTSNNATNSVGQIGYFDNEDGIYFQHEGDGSDGSMSVGIRFGASDTHVAQNDWNIDPMDGTGPSALSVNFDKIQTYTMEMSWDNIIRMGILISGKMIAVHEFHDQTTHLLTANPNLPVRYSLSATGSVSSATLRHYSTFVSSDAGYEPIGRMYAVNNVASPVKINSTVEKPIFIMRHGDFDLHKGKIKPVMLDIINTSPSHIIYRIYKYRSPGSIPVRGITDSSFTTGEGTLAKYAFGGSFIDGDFDDTRILLYQGIFTELANFDFDKYYKNNSVSTLSGDLSSNSDYLVVSCQLTSGCAAKSIIVMASWIEYV